MVAAVVGRENAEQKFSAHSGVGVGGKRVESVVKVSVGCRNVVGHAI